MLAVSPSCEAFTSLCAVQLISPTTILQNLETHWLSCQVIVVAHAGSLEGGAWKLGCLLSWQACLSLRSCEFSPPLRITDSWPTVCLRTSQWQKKHSLAL